MGNKSTVDPSLSEHGRTSRRSDKWNFGYAKFEF